MIKALMFMPFLLGGISGPALANEMPSIEVSESVNTKMPTHKSVSYNDEHYVVTLTLDEVKDYEWDNLYALYSDNNSIFTASVITYNSIDINYDSDTVWAYNVDDFNIAFGVLEGTDYDSEINNFRLYESGSLVDFEYGIALGLGSDYYSAVKEAIEADINANSGMPTIQDIFTTVTQAVTSFVGSLGQAFNSVTALFYANGAWTFLGILILIAVGVGLIYLAYRVIKGLLHRV